MGYESNRFATIEESRQALSVSAVMEQVRLDSPRGAVTIKGVVGALRPFPPDKPTVIYGDLEDIDGEYKMSFRCPLGSAPVSVKEFVVLQGSLKIDRARHHAGYDLQLIGNKIGNWIPDASMNEVVVLPKADRAKIPFERFIANGAVKRVAFIGTERALKDAESTFRRTSQEVFPVFPVTTTLEQLQIVVTEVARSFDALCFLRGGGDSSSFSLWNDSRLILVLLRLQKPFYTAIGHSTDFTLADKYSDESFVTPSDLGSAYSAALTARNEREYLERQLDNVNERYRVLQTEKDSQIKLATEREQAAIAKAKRNLQTAIILAVLLVLAIILILVHLS